MPPMDPFAADGYSLAELTAAINILPNQYGLINQLGIFRDQGVTTRSILVEEQNGSLNLLPSLPVGSPGTVGSVGKRKLRSFSIPHIPHDDVIHPADVQGIRAFGVEDQAKTIAGAMAEKLQIMRNKHAITLEWMRMGALKGILIDGDASTTLYNFYTEFAIVAKTVYFDFANSDDIRASCLEVLRHIDANLKGEIMTGVVALVSSGFFDLLTAHDSVKDAFKYYQTNQNLAGDYRRQFVFAGITFREYVATATTPEGTSHAFITANKGHAFPMGTSSAFATFYAPADFNETVNTIGLAMYAKQEPKKFGRGWDLHTQSNPFPICLRPAVLVTLDEGAGA